MQTFTSKHIDPYFDYPEFIDFLQAYYQMDLTTPVRNHYEVNAAVGGTMLMMPSWGDGKYMGVKLVNVFPENKEIPSINGVYILMSKESGEVIAQFEGLSLTCKRTAAVSALAVKLLRKKPMKTMLMLGTGNMSLELIKAHHAIQGFSEIGIWGRNREKAEEKVGLLKQEGIPVVVVSDKDAYANEADLISVATLAKEPILFGAGLRDAVYVDLVGSYQKGTREADDAVIKNAKIYVDTYHALEESGELLIPLKTGLIEEQDVLADIIRLSGREFKTQDHAEDKIVFKSVGFAASDLACASYLMSKIK